MDPISIALGLGSKLIDHFFPDAAQADAAKLKLLELQQSGELAQLTGQLEINKIEAATTNLFVSGWRPYIGWMCGTALGYQFLFYPIAVAYLPRIVQLDMGTLLTLLVGMLGMSGMRTAEKLQGVAAK